MNKLEAAKEKVGRFHFLKQIESTGQSGNLVEMRKNIYDTEGYQITQLSFCPDYSELEINNFGRPVIKNEYNNFSPNEHLKYIAYDL